MGFVSLLKNSVAEKIFSLYRSAKWSEINEKKKYAFIFLAHIALLAAIAVFFSQFLLYVEQRSGFEMYDPILPLFTAIDVTWLIFALLYSGSAVGVFLLLRNPSATVLALRTYIFLLLFRVCAMYLLPLEPPKGMIALHDPFVELFWSSGIVLTKDLFFSGHTATMVFLSLTAQKKHQKLLFAVLAAAVGVLVILQKVHYTADVLAAPIFAYFAYWSARKSMTHF